VHPGSIIKIRLAVILALGAAGCTQSRPRMPSIGEAYVGPATLKIRADIPLQSPIVATVQHGDRLEILQRRRRFLRVRTHSGTEGWTDERQLMAAADMTYLNDLAQRAAKLPAQGQGTTYSEINVHTQPARQSPSFIQIKQKEKVDILLHIVTPRTELPRTPLLPPPAKKTKAAPKKTSTREPKYPPPPMPKAPAPPPNWLDLSKTDLSEEAPPPEEEVDEKPTPTDEWSLIRMPSGQSGWVLTRRLVMAIPDEVAQYAEGRRIVSYFSLGKVADGDQKKDVWLWTTVTEGQHPYDFESFRVFIWSLRRHRYETAHIERNLRGYAPVLLKEVDYGGSKYPGFSVCVDGKDGQRHRREYALLVNVVRSAGEYPCETTPPPVEALQAFGKPAPIPTSEPPPAAPESFSQRIKKRLGAIFKRSG
jgi:SH3-like domain-containing protein